MSAPPGLLPVTQAAACLRAPNPGPMTLDGTNSYVLRQPGERSVVVVDPGPDDPAHLERLAASGDVTLIVLTHSHPDHSDGVARLHELTSAPVAARDPAWCVDHPPLTEGPLATSVGGLQLLVVPTPGHTPDSVCLLLPADRALLTGDTVLGRGTTVIAHPEGRLGDYLTSLRRLRDLADGSVDLLLCGHGPVRTDPVAVLDGYLAHRRDRLEQVREAVASGVTDAPGVVRAVYADVDPRLWPAAELSVRAQLDHLAELDEPAGDGA